MPGVLSGLEYLWSVDLDDQGGTPDFQDLPQQRDGGLNLELSRVDATHKGNAGWRSQAAVTRQVSGEISGALEDDNAVLEFLESKILGDLDQGKAYFRFTQPGGDIWSCWCWFSIEYSTPHAELAEYTVSLESDGVVTKA